MTCWSSNWSTSRAVSSRGVTFISTSSNRQTASSVFPLYQSIAVNRRPQFFITGNIMPKIRCSRMVNIEHFRKFPRHPVELRQIQDCTTTLVPITALAPRPTSHVVTKTGQRRILIFRIRARVYNRCMEVGPPPGESREKKPYIEPAFATGKASENSVRDAQSPSPTPWDRLKRALVHLLENLLFEPQSGAQTEQLARKILDHGRLIRRGSEPTEMYIPELAVRFREPHRNVRRALELLEEQGTIERTNSKDRWRLTSPASSPIRVPYIPPRVSWPSATMLLNPPPGWIELQNRAHRAKDSHEFGEIIAEMNRLLSASEKAVANRRDPVESSTPEGDKKPPLKRRLDEE
jgi:hypothetical protein